MIFNQAERPLLLGFAPTNKALSQPHLFGLQGGLGAVADAQFPQDVRHVILHGSFSQKRCVGNLSIAGAG